MTPPLTVRLTWSEILQAAIVGVSRRIISIRRGLNKNKHARKSDWATDIDGALAEMAVAKAMNVHWGGDVNTFKLPDVGQLQIRSTAHRKGHLILRDNDQGNAPYVLVVTSEIPLFLIIGWIGCAEAKIGSYRRSGSDGEADAWWVPQQNLHPFRALLTGSTEAAS